MRIFKTYFTFLFFWSILSFNQKTKAQTIDSSLTRIEIAALSIEVNLGIKIAKIDAKIADLNTQIGASGMLPQVMLTADLPNSINNIQQEFVNGGSIENPRATSNAFNANVMLNYTIFDGFRMFATRERFQALADMGEINVRQKIEQTLFETELASLMVIRYQQEVAVQQENVGISEQRYNQLQDKYLLGKASKAALFQAEVDLNTDKSNLLQQKGLLKVAQVQLNGILQRDAQATIFVRDSLIMPQLIGIDTWVEKANRDNTQLSLAIQQQKIAIATQKEARAAYAPEISISAGYHFNRLQSQAGFLLSNQNRGWDYGLTARWNLFDGSRVHRNVQSARLMLQQTELEQRQISINLSNQLHEAFARYQTNYYLAQLAIENEFVAQKNLEFVQERFDLGMISQLDLRTAQLSLMQVQLNKQAALYELFVAKAALELMSGGYQK